MDPSRIRNFCIIAHIDHGKSTLADRMLELTGTVSDRELKEQTLDQMDIERERGITIKLAPVRMRWTPHSDGATPRSAATRDPLHRARGDDGGSLRRDGRDPSATLQDGSRGTEYVLHLIDTPGHVDFSYEVSRSLAAVEGAVLLVDATQGVQAQTLANLYVALAEDLTIIPVVNKIDLPAADVDRARGELVDLLGCAPEDVLAVSGKTGAGVAELLDAIVDRVPYPAGGERKADQRDEMRRAGASTEGDALSVRRPRNAATTSPGSRCSGPEGSAARAAPTSRGAQGAPTDRALAVSPLRALIFDSLYDDYRGVVAYVRVVDGSVRRGDQLQLCATGERMEALEVGSFAPKLVPTEDLGAGEIGYIVTGTKDIRQVRVGDTVTHAGHPAARPLEGYQEVKPMVFAGVFPKRADDTQELREAIERLRLNDAALQFEPERSQALGVGFRCGFLGLLHLEVFRERLVREYEVDSIVTVPSVAYRVFTAGSNDVLTTRSPQELPDPSRIEHIEEPWVRMDIVTPERYVGTLMQLCQEKRGAYQTTEYLGGGQEGDRRSILRYELPLAVVLVDFYDRLKSISQGYASMNYETIGYRPANVRRLDILVAGDLVESLASMVYEDEAQQVGRRIVEQLKTAIPRHQFEVRLQAALGGKVVASERIAPLRKDVTAKLYGGDVTRKKKLLEKQKKGKKAMRASGRVDVPPEAYVAVLKR